MIFPSPTLNTVDEAVLSGIYAMRTDMADLLRVPRRWNGGLRRHAMAQAIRGSNSIEGYVVEVDDAAAAVDDEDALTADQRTFAEIRGYRQALGYVLATAEDPHFAIDTSTIKSLHFMLLGHDLSKSPGTFRTGPIFVHDEATDTQVYEGPEAATVPALIDELIESLRTPGVDALVDAAMAHLNLVMIHPFRDGSGRLARALQTLVLTRRGIGEPVFSSIEEWLGANTKDYYRALAHTGAGHWQPERSASLWLSFNLRAHHMQAQTMQGRMRQSIAMWEVIDDLIAERSLPERSANALWEAAIGYRIRRSTYMKRNDIEERTASRDLRLLVDADLLRAVGETRARHYVAADGLAGVREVRMKAKPTLVDPYPDMPARLAAPINA